MPGPQTSGPQFRTFTPDLEVRSGGDGRTIYGIAVPYHQPTFIYDGLTEQFARGAFNHQIRTPERVQFAREHMILGGDLIGRATLLRDDAKGLYTEFHVSRTPNGDETLELARDGALRDLSVMFEERQNRDLPGGITERVTANLFEVAATTWGAYGDGATIDGVRSATDAARTAAMHRGEPVDMAYLAAQARAAKYLPGLPELPDYDLRLRLARLGLSAE